MAILRLAFRLATRNRIRMAITILGVAFTLVAFLMLRTLVGNWYSTSEATARSDQLIVRHKISISFVLYKRMAEQIMTIPDVTAVSALLWFSGYYADEQARFGQLAVEVDKYFQIYPEYAASPDEMAAFLADRSGAIVGSDLAKRYGWKVGDKVTLTGTIFPGNWDLTVRGIYPGEEGYNRDWLFMHYDRVQPPDGLSHRLAVKAAPGAARQIDEMFANSQTPTKTESELAVRRTWASWSSGIVAAIDMGSLLVLLVLVLVLGNGMAMAARESTGEYAAMRAIGYRSKHIVALVMAEGFIIAGVGVAIGLAAMPAVLGAFSELMEERLGGSWSLELELWTTVAGVLGAVLASAVASAWPAWRSGHLPIVVALRRVA